MLHQWSLSSVLLAILLYCCIGVYVIGSGDSGVLFEHRESEFGDHANVTDIMTAVQQAKAST